MYDLKHKLEQNYLKHISKIQSYKDKIKNIRILILKEINQFQQDKQKILSDYNEYLHNLRNKQF